MDFGLEQKAAFALLNKKSVTLSLASCLIERHDAFLYFFAFLGFFAKSDKYNDRAKVAFSLFL